MGVARDIDETWPISLSFSVFFPVRINYAVCLKAEGSGHVIAVHHSQKCMDPAHKD